jgi:hypothetical protein
MSITRHSCACGWYRDRGSQAEQDPGHPQWDSTVIDHPLHGTVTNAGAAARDIAVHDCAEHQAALARLRAAIIKRMAA